MDGAQILLVEDEPDVALGLHDFLTDCGFIVDSAANGPSALGLFAANEYDAIILDLLLPGLNGIDLCRRLREGLNCNTPVLMLTALVTLEDKLAGFSAGADDYLAKPFEPLELAARLRALIIRARGGHRRELRVGPLRFDTRTLEISREGRPLNLNAQCRTLLEALMRVSPEVISRSRLERILWGDAPPDTDSLRTHIYLLRKVVDSPFGAPMIETVHGLGYRIVASR